MKKSVIELVPYFSLARADGGLPMTNSWSRIALVTLFCLFAFTASASAECAWIEWSYTIDKGKGIDLYHIESAWPTRQECLTDVRLSAVILKQEGYTVTGGGPESNQIFGRKEGERIRYFCLPDTVDPRGPKGR